jgi:RNA polymerase sigma factor (sigma-70 family)
MLLASVARLGFLSDQKTQDKQHKKSGPVKKLGHLHDLAAREKSVATACPPMVHELMGPKTVPVANPDFDSIYRTQRHRIARAVRAVIGPSDEVEDVVQNAMLEIYRSLPRFQGRSKVSTWVYRVAVNVALQHLRQKKRRQWLLFGRDARDVEQQRSPGDAAAQLEGREALRLVFGLLHKLSAKKRIVWILHELEGLTPQQIAEILEIPMNTVRSRLMKGRAEIKAAMKRMGIDMGEREP